MEGTSSTLTVILVDSLINDPVATERARSQIPVDALYYTNDSTKTQLEWHHALTKIGFNVDVERVITSATLTAAYMKQCHPTVSKAICFCSAALKQELT
jgi:ribonucleotide monophosphatase NagD (HAD superfamily)